MVLLNPVFLEEMEELCTESLPWEEIDDSTFLIAGGTGLVGAGLTDFLIYRNEYNVEAIPLSFYNRENQQEHPYRREDFMV